MIDPDYIDPDEDGEPEPDAVIQTPPLSFPCFYMTMNEQKIKMTTLTNPTDEHGRNWNFRSRRSSCPFAARRVWMQEYQRREGIKCMSWCIADAPCLCGKCAKGSMSTTH